MTEQELIEKLRAQFDYLRKPCPFKPGDIVRVRLDEHGNPMVDHSVGLAIVLEVEQGRTSMVGSLRDVTFLHLDPDDDTFEKWSMEGWRLELVEEAP